MSTCTLHGERILFTAKTCPACEHVKWIRLALKLAIKGLLRRSGMKRSDAEEILEEEINSYMRLAREIQLSKTITARAKDIADEA